MPVRALMLAAGEGSRLKGRLGYVKIAAKIEGIPLMCYPLTSLAVAGVSEVYIATRKDRVELVKSILGECPLTPCVEVVAVSRWWAGNAWTMLEALDIMGRGVYLVSMSDHIYPPELASGVAKGCSKPVCIGGDSKPGYVDLNEATKIKASSDGSIVKLGKNLEDWTHVDVGVHLIAWGPITGKCVSPTLTLNEVNVCNAALGAAGVVDVTGYPWMDVDSPEDLDYAVRGPGRSVVREVIERWRL